jgi:hypothetical protein
VRDRPSDSVELIVPTRPAAAADTLKERRGGSIHAPDVGITRFQQAGGEGWLRRPTQPGQIKTRAVEGTHSSNACTESDTRSKDVARSVAFYTTHLGFALEHPQIERGRQFQLDARCRTENERLDERQACCAHHLLMREQFSQPLRQEVGELQRIVDIEVAGAVLPLPALLVPVTSPGRLLISTRNSLPTRKPVRGDSLRFSWLSHSLRFGDADRCIRARSRSFAGSLPRRAAPRDSRASTPASGVGTLGATARTFDRSRPPALGLVLAHLARLAGGARPRSARDGRRLAPLRLSSVLGLEEPTANGPGERPARRPRVDPDRVRRQSPLACASDPWRAAETWHHREPVNGREVHGPAPTVTVADVADVPREPHRAGGGR